MNNIEEKMTEVRGKIADIIFSRMTETDAIVVADLVLDLQKLAIMSGSISINKENVPEILMLRNEIERLKKQINVPEVVEFIKAVQLESAHQRERWPSEHDSGKTTEDWFWLIGYLGGKALHNLKSGNIEKGLHHIITTAAACANWHSAQLGGSGTIMRPGINTGNENENER